MATGLLGTEAIPQNPLFNTKNLIKNIRVPGLSFAGAAPAAGLLTAFYPSSGAGADELAWEAANMRRMMSAQDVIDSHLSQSENNYKTWDFGYQMSEADARAKGYIIPPDPTVTDEERKKNLTLPNIPPDIDLPQHTGDTSGQQVELPQHTGSPPVEWDFPIHTGDTSPPYIPTLDDIIMRSETDEGLLQDDKVTSGILDETAPPFYSKIKKTIEDAKMDKGSADQWTGYINNAGVNQEELDWIGLKDYLADRKSVTKEDVLNFVEMNDLAVQVKDIVLGAESDAIRFTGDTMEMIEGQGTTLTWDSRVPEILRNAAGYQDAKNIVVNDEGLYNQYKEYLRETEQQTADDPITYFLQDEFGMFRGSSDQGKTMFNRPQLITEGDYTDYKEMVFQLPIEGSEFTQGHYTKYPNTFAHARFNTREIDGKKTLFIEELQSDWIHKGKEKGFITGKERTYDIVNKEIDDLVSQRTSGGMSKEEYLPKYNALLEELNDIARLDTGVTSEKVPDIPFKKNWQDIVLKRLIRYASENGFDAIAMTGGNIQADRYDLSKQVNEIIAQKYDDGIHLKVYDLNDSKIIDKEKLSIEELEQHIGKELADKIKLDIEKNPTSQSRHSGMDLKVGGEGLKSMYDKIFSKSLNKIGKKFDAKVELKNLSDFQDLGYAIEDLKALPRRPRQYYFETPDEAYDFITDDEFLNEQFMAWFKSDLNELDPVSLLENANQDEKNAYISEFFRSSAVGDLNEGQEFQLKLKTKDNQLDMWFMDLTPSMKKKAIEAGFPIAYNKPVSPLFQFA